MSKETFIKGFCKAAEEHGVDPVQLAKYAATSDTSDAGLGTPGDNYLYVNSETGKVTPSMPMSYRGRLVARHPGLDHNVELPLYLGPGNEWGRISVGDLKSTRDEQARYNASYLYPWGSAPFNKVVNNLTNAGIENYRSYLETGDTKERAEPNLQGIEKLKLTPEQKKQLLQMQNTMVRNSAPRQKNIV